MNKIALANRLSLRIMVVVMLMAIVIMVVIYPITRDIMVKEAESRYESVIRTENERIRGVLSDVYVAAINNHLSGYHKTPGRQDLARLVTVTVVTM